MNCKFQALALVAVCATAGYAQSRPAPSTPPCGPTIKASLSVCGRPVTSCGLDIDCFELTQCVASPYLTAGSNGQEPLGGTLTLNSCDCDPAWYEVIKAACRHDDPVDLKLWVTFPGTTSATCTTTSIDLAGLCLAPANPCGSDGCCGYAFTFAAKCITFGLEDPGNTPTVDSSGHFALGIGPGPNTNGYSFFPTTPHPVAVYPDVCSFTFLSVSPDSGTPGKVMAKRPWLGDLGLFTLLVNESYDPHNTTPPFLPLRLRVDAPAETPWSPGDLGQGLECQVTIKVTECGCATEMACFDYLPQTTED